MKKNWFSLRLYLEGIRQLRLIGIMGMVILSLEAILIPVGRLVNIREMRHFTSSSITKTLLNFPEMHPLLVLCFCVLAPLMVLYLFHFLNKRNASDFYHAIPETRLCLYISFFAAVVTWLLAIIVLTSFLSVAIFLCFPVYFSVNLMSVLVMCFNVFAGSLLVAASVAVAMCVTGTIFTNIIVSLMIIFIPRLLIYMLVTSVTSSLPLVSSADFIPLLDIGYNVPVGTVVMLGSGGVLSNWQSGVYTLVLALVYTVCAALLFRVRRSEAAGQAAPNRILQAVYRLVLAMVVCSFACYSIFQGIINRSQYASTSYGIYEYIVLYVIALVVFFLYELITTRKWRNLARAIPSLLVLILLNAALVGGMTGLYRSALSFAPAADDISSIRILSNGRNSNYFAARTEHRFPSAEYGVEALGTLPGELFPLYRTGNRHPCSDPQPRHHPCAQHSHAGRGSGGTGPASCRYRRIPQHLSAASPDRPKLHDRQPEQLVPVRLRRAGGLQYPVR